ncbi:MAG: ABC-F family ATP-binding cassette domain-containing protein [Treponema sp.]|jgi:ATP-binding cassette subfamily F protein 3|nr:ABC-F family ATP-binding cassette domain-containing protein [Treponema sp.]
MAYVQFSRLSLAFGERDLLRNISIRLSTGSRCCLTGANGCGKSTLMKILSSNMNADSCEKAIQKGARISYLPQSGIVHKGKSLRDEVETSYVYIHNLLKRIDEIGLLLEKTNSDNEANASLIEEHHLLQEQVENSGYYRRESDIFTVLTGLGFLKQDIPRDTLEFSGGWQMRIALAKILLEKPDIMLLDEPTNYLDIEARAWLESRLSSFTGGYLLVSHDRYFLDLTVNEVYELFQGELTRYAGNYSAYEKIRQVELASLVKRYKEQREEIEKTENLIRRFRYKASKAAFAQELIKRLEKMEKIEIPDSLKNINITFPQAPHSGKIALTLENITKNYGERRVLSALDLNVDSGERIVVAGPNGAGKSTLLRIIAGQDKDFFGTVKYGSGIVSSYFSQDAAETLQDNVRIIDFTEADAPAFLIPKLRDMLGAFLFRGDDVYKNVSVLSGGEKSRLALLKILLKPVNLLILDEPTNHLDLHSKDILLDALLQFTGTIIFVSHDRAFMEALSVKTLELRPGAGNNPASAKLFYGNYAYYLEETNGVDSAIKPADTIPISGIKTPLIPELRPPQKPKNNLNEKRIQDKQKQAAIRRLEKQEEDILDALGKLEEQKSRLETDLSLVEVYSDGDKAKLVKSLLNETIRAIQTRTTEWEAVLTELERVKREQ